MPILFRARSGLIAAAGLVSVAACVISSDTTFSKIDKSMVAGRSVSAPIKAHMLDGSVAVFAHGAEIDATRVVGNGRRFDVTRKQTVEIVGVPLDSVLGFEVYERQVNPFRTLVYSAAVTVASIVGAVTAAVILFGSCPTIYADSAGVQTLQAESFSYSISPLLGKRDVDLMTVQPNASGIIRLAVRNEALETHHLDHMEIVEVRHAPGEIVVPSPRGGMLALTDFAPVIVATDGAGRNVSRVLARADESSFTTDDGVLDRAIAGGPTDDHITLTLPRRAGSDSIALLLKARSSLLTTSVLYEHLMGRQGVLALDWMANLSKITTLAQLGGWYGSNFGMRVEIEDGEQWKQVIRLMDFGPTAWRTVGVALPSSGNARDSIRVRLTFAADAFRIDQLAIAQRIRRPEQRFVSIAHAEDSEHQSRPDIVTMLSHADDREVETHPGEQFWIDFNVGNTPGVERTFLFAAQGYYTEWLRPSWIRNTTDPKPFSPSTTPMRELLRSWKGGRDSLEKNFFLRKAPIA